MYIAIGALLLVGIATFIVVNVFLVDQDKFKTSEILEDNLDDQQIKSLGIIFKYSRPFFRRYISPLVASIRSKNKIREKYKRKLSMAGFTHILSPDDFFAYKLFLIIGFPIIFVSLRLFLEENWSLFLVPVVAGVGYLYPDIWLSGKIKKRQEEILQNMPFIVDLLALSVEAGLDFIAAISRVIARAPKSALRNEFEQLVKEIRLGSSRREALKAMSWRVNLMPINSFCATLIAADSVGASIGPILKNLSEEIRREKTSLVEKKGAQAATKILFPMIGFILPAVIIMALAPFIMEYVNQ